jgi:phosphatidate cytidylyltransferase
MPIYAGMKIRRSENGANWLVYGMMSTWACDAIAYLMGPHMPGPSLPDWLNGQKKWFGYLPGIVFSITIGVIARPRLKISRTESIFLGSLMGVASAMGDMFESGLKRQAQQADAGNILPGYGGILDRLDSMLATSSVLYWAYMKWAPQIPRS